jgi:hypothetical protein
LIETNLSSNRLSRWIGLGLDTGLEPSIVNLSRREKLIIPLTTKKDLDKINTISVELIFRR